VADGRREADLWGDHLVHLHQFDELGVEDRLILSPSIARAPRVDGDHHSYSCLPIR